MCARYQGGYLRLGRRKTRPDCWEFLCWDTEPAGRRVRPTAVIGSVQQFPIVEDLWRASNGLRVSINEARNRQREQAITVGDLIDHYIKMELLGALPGDTVGARLLKNMVGPNGLEPLTSTVSILKVITARIGRNRRAPSIHAAPKHLPCRFRHTCYLLLTRAYLDWLRHNPRHKATRRGPLAE